MMMGEGRIHEIALSLMLSEVYSRRQVVGILKYLGGGASGGGVGDLFIDAPKGGMGDVNGAADKVDEARRLLDDLARQGVGVTCLADAGYPRLLKEIPDPPPVLFHRGDLPQADGGAVAIVGARKASLGGIRFAGRLAEELAHAGFMVVSGLARGIDTAAHRGALGAGGVTVAVLGCGIDITYPPENEALSSAIAANGAVVTELLPGVLPLRHNFPRRNRIISGLSLGTVVVEAGEKSGALITAACALEQNRSVFAVPGTPGFYGSKGTNSLLRQGAKLVESVEDVLEEVAPQVSVPGSSRLPGAPPPAATRSEEMVLGLLSAVPVHVDELTRNLDLASREVVNILFQLETRGLVRSMPGKFYVREGTV
jgi:DNA processing protein